MLDDGTKTPDGVQRLADGETGGGCQQGQSTALPDSTTRICSPMILDGRRV